MSIKGKTAIYYNKNSQTLSKKFAEFGGNYDIEGIINLVNKENPKILEIGCGDGRDAKKILKYTDDYLGFDISKEMINLAKKNVPQGKFMVKDLENFIFPKNIDIVFALTSLLHINKTVFNKLFNKLTKNINLGGLFYISLKYGNYSREIVKDELGTRVFYFYKPQDIIDMVAKNFKLLYKDVHTQKGRKFFIIVLQRI